jgi:hypothetical protein
MGYDLHNAHRDMRFTGAAWGALLHLAQQYGWEPAGTEAPTWSLNEEEAGQPWADWSGSYLCNDYQMVTDADAGQLAAALERALPDIPDHAAQTAPALATRVAAPFDVLVGLAGVQRCGEDITAPALFSGPNKAVVRDFIHFCRESGFVVG